MVEFVLLYRLKEGVTPEEFEEKFRSIHIPIAVKMPNLRRYTIGKGLRGPQGRTRWYRVALVEFDTAEDVEKMLASPEWKALVEDDEFNSRTEGAIGAFFEMERVFER